MEIVIGTRRLTKKLGLFVAENCLDCHLNRASFLSGEPHVQIIKQYVQKTYFSHFDLMLVLVLG